MRVFLILSLVVFNASLLLGQTTNPDKDRYAIVEVALLADDAFNLHATVDNDRLLTLTKDLTQIKTIDTTIVFDEKTTTNLQLQLKTTSITRWEKNKIYRFQVLDHDPLAGVDPEGNIKLDSAHQKYMNKTVRLQRASLPLFIDQLNAFLLIEGKVVTFQDGAAILNSNYSKIYFVHQVKKRWKVKKVITLSAN